VDEPVPDPAWIFQADVRGTNPDYTV